jgi:hypothetical protein
MKLDALGILPATRLDGDTLAVLEETERYFQGGKLWMRGYWPNDEGTKCLLAAVKWAMLETHQPLHSAERYLAQAITGSEVEFPCRAIMAFNDAPGRTYAEIEAVLHRACELVLTPQ